MTGPFQDECRNNGWDARFTCPGCYADLDYSAWQGRTDACPSCGRTITCTVESEPVSVCRLADPAGTLSYGDDGIYAVELFDQVDVRMDGCVHAGEITRIHARSGEVRVRYADGYDIARTTGNPRVKSARVPVSAVDLIARDG